LKIKKIDDVYMHGPLKHPKWSAVLQMVLF